MLLLSRLAVLQAFNLSECLCEVFDNSIRAEARHISVDSSRTQALAVSTLPFCGDGVSSSSSSSGQCLLSSHGGSTSSSVDCCSRKLHSEQYTGCKQGSQAAGSAMLAGSSCS